MLPEPTDPRGRLALEAARVASRLAALGPRRVPNEAMAGAAAALAVLAWRGEDLPGDPPGIRVEPHGWGDVVRVLAADLAAAPGPGADRAAAEAADLLGDLRRTLP